MSLSSSSHVSKKSSKSHTTEATVATVPAVPSATAASTGAVTETAPTVTSAFTKKVIAQLDALEASLGLDIVIRPKEKSLIGAGNRVSDTAIGLAADIVSAAPGRFPDFTGLPTASDYLQAYGQVASRAKELVMHLTNSLNNQRVPAATQTLALYAVVKGLGRIVGNETMGEKVTALKAEVAPKRKNPKPKVTKGQKAAKRLAQSTATKVEKAQAVLAKAGVSPVSPSVAPAAAVIVTPAATAATPIAGH